MKTLSKFRSFVLTMMSLMLIASLTVPSAFTAQAIVIPGDDEELRDEGIFGITKYRYDHDTKTIYLSHAKEDSIYNERK